jgi:hypothetical protein
MITVDLHESAEERMEQVAEALLAAAYDPITCQANWPRFHQLGPMARERLLRIARHAVNAAPGGSDDAKAIAWMDAVSNNLIDLADWSN